MSGQETRKITANINQREKDIFIKKLYSLMRERAKTGGKLDFFPKEKGIFKKEECLALKI